MKIVVIHALHYAIDKRPVSRLYFDIVQKLIENGNIVIVLTAKNGQVAKSYFGEQIIYVNNWGYLREGLFLRIIDYISFYIKSFSIVSKKSSSLNRNSTSIINLVKSGYGLSAFIAMIYKKVFKNHIVFWVLDRYPDVMFSNKKNRGITFKVLKQLQTYSLNHFDKLIFETKSDKLDYYKNNGTSASTIINTWSSINMSLVNYTKPNFWDKYNLSNKNIVVYSGNIGYSFDKKKLINLLNRYSDLFFIILGQGSFYNNLITDKNINIKDNILLVPYLPEEEYYYTLVNSLYGLVLLKEGVDVFSSKITTYLSFNKPIIGAIDKVNEMYDLINNNCGIVISEEYPKIPTKGNEYERYVYNAKITSKLFSKDYNTNLFVETLLS